MAKYITCGKWNPNYKYIFFTIIFLAIYKMALGFGYDGNKELSTKFIKNGKFGSNYLIHENFSYLFCIIVSCILILIEKKCIFKKKNKNNEIEKNKNNNLLSVKNVNPSDGDIDLIYTKMKKEKYSIIFVLFIIFIEIILEQFSLMYYKFFTHCNFWMIKLYFAAYFYLKIFHLEIYKHQYLAFGINFIATIINVIKAILTIIEDKEERALYVKYHWCFILGLILFLIYAFFESYIFVLLKKIFYVNFISSSQILFFYGIIGFFVTLFLCISFTYMPCGKKIENIHEIKDYICRVTNYENQTYIDNIKIYYIENWENAEDIIKKK